jgi:hypothetical protein
MLTDGASEDGLAVDCMVLTTITAVPIMIAARMYPLLTM